MIFSFNKHLNILGMAVVMMVGFYSCSSKVDEKPISNQTATFEVLTVTGQASKTKVKKSVYWAEIEQSKSAEFKVCLVDQATQAPLINEDMNISLNGTNKTITSNLSGCLKWKQRFDYTFLNQETFQNHQLIISGANRYSGEYTVPVAINPWRNDATIIKDLRYTSVSGPDQVYLNKEAQFEGMRQFEVKRVNLALKKSKIFNAKEKDLLFSYLFESNITLVRKNIDGLYIPVTISKALFDIEITLIEDNGHELTKISSKTLSDIEVNNGTISAPFEVIIKESHLPDHNSNVYALFSFSPKKANAVLNRFSGKVSMNLLERNTESVFTESVPSELIAEKVIEHHQEKNINTDIDKQFGIMASNRVVPVKGAVYPNSKIDKSMKKMKTHFEICLEKNQGTSQNEPVKDTRFDIDVYLENGVKDLATEKRTVTPDDNGCFSTYAIIPFLEYDTRDWIFFNIKISGTDGEYKESYLSKSLAINPWSNTNFGYDIDHDGYPGQVQDLRKPEVRVTELRTIHEGFDNNSPFFIDDKLHISFMKKYRFIFSPKAKFFQTTDTHNPLESIIYGKFKLKVTLFGNLTGKKEDNESPDLNSFELLSSSEKIVEVGEDGDISESLSFPFDIANVIMMRFIGVAHVELTPQGHGNLQASSFTVPFYGMKNEEPRKTALSFPIDQILDDEEKLERIDQYLYTYGLKTKETSPIKNSTRILNELKMQNQSNPDGKINYVGTRSELATLQPIGSRKDALSLELKKKYLTPLSKRYLKEMSKQYQSYAKDLLRPLCRYFYKLTPKHSKDSLIYKCYENPRSYLNAMPIFIVDEILTVTRVKDKKGHHSIQGVAKFVDDDFGSMHRGDAFMAATGDRSSLTTGDTTETSEHIGGGLEIRIPFVGGLNYSQEGVLAKFSINAYDRMQASFTRSYTDVSLKDFQFNRLSLSFAAEGRNCIVAESKQSDSSRVYLCADENSSRMIQEDWYLITDVNVDNHGLLANGNIPSSKNLALHQILRGNATFDKMWAGLQDEERLIVLEDFDKVIPGNVLKEPLTEMLNRDHSLVGYNSPSIYIPMIKTRRE